MLAGNVVVITGAGSGLGRELAKAFVAKESKVVGIGRSAESLSETAKLCGGAFEAKAADVADVDQMKRLFADLARSTGAVDTLFNNAAVYPR